MTRRGKLKKLMRFLPWLLLPLFAVALTLLELRLKRTRPDKAKPEVVWLYDTPIRGAIVSSPTVHDGRVYVGVIRDTGLSPAGVVMAFDADSGAVLWENDAGGAMIHMYSSPRIANGRLYIGEGMHANFDCKLSCMDIANGKTIWRFPVGHHIESTPCIADGRVFFGAGDHGLLAVDATSGSKLWHFDKNLHIDSSPVVLGGRVFGNSGISKRFKGTEVFALDVADGEPAWRLPIDLPAWSSPVVDRGHVFVGLGNGRLTRSDEKPAGAILCVDARTGKRQWQTPLPDGVLCHVAVDEDRVYAGCRDGWVYALSRSDGRVAWKANTGSPVATAPALLDGRLYVASSAGRLICYEALTGVEIDSFDAAEHIGHECKVYSSPFVQAEPDGRHRIYFGAEAAGLPGGNVAVLFCVRF